MNGWLLTAWSLTLHLILPTFIYASGAFIHFYARLPVTFDGGIYFGAYWEITASFPTHLLQVICLLFPLLKLQAFLANSFLAHQCRLVFQ